jgi:hypothetical protein
MEEDRRISDIAILGGEEAENKKCLTGWNIGPSESYRLCVI